MPKVCEFDGIRIYIYFILGEHLLPHFHVRYAGERASFSIEEFDLLEGKLSPAILRKVRDFHRIHARDLMSNWELLEKGKAPFSINYKK